MIDDQDNVDDLGWVHPVFWIMVVSLVSTVAYIIYRQF